jgi:two-component system nitrogen regulation sensor histidine kinase NtrY
MNLPLRTRMFLAMVGLIVLSFLMTGTISYFFFLSENEEYNFERIKRKEYAIRSTVDYFISETKDDLFLNPERLVEIFDDRICELADIHNQDIGFYDFNGKYLISSLAPGFDNRLFPPFLADDLRIKLTENTEATQAVEDKLGVKYLISASVVVDDNGKPIAILTFPYELDKRFDETEMREFFENLFGVFFLLFGLAVAIALFLSNSIARPLTRLKQRIAETRLDNNRPITDVYPPEIQSLSREYNRMLSALQKSATELAKRERDSAWRDMARQVAHEIKNPLTPMKLNLQMMAMKNPEQSDMIKGLIVQVDAMAQIADAFSRYANIPELQTRNFKLDEMLSSGLSVLGDNGVKFINRAKEEIHFHGDPDQLTRAVNNLVKNALQAGKDGTTPKVEVYLDENDKEITLTVKDDGIGIPASEHEHIFEPKFTTKTSGMGLGLSIVRTIIEGHGGRISLVSSPGKGSSFTVHLPKR